MDPAAVLDAPNQSRLVVNVSRNGGNSHNQIALWRVNQLVRLSWPLILAIIIDAPPSGDEGESVVSRKRRGGNNRALPRIDLEVKVNAASDSGTHTGATINISAGGVFVATEEPMSVGDQLKLELTLPDSKESISLDSKVRWVRRRRVAGRRDRPAGMGLQFVNLTTETSSVIGSFLQAHLSPFAGRARSRS